MSEGYPGGGRKERNDNDNVINNVIITPPPARLIVTFSITPRFFQLWEKFLKIAKREAGSRGRSEVFAKMLDEYVRRHDPGNPQTPLTTFMDPLAPGPINVQCNYIRGARSDGLVYHEVFKNGLWEHEWIQGIKCYSCPKNKLRKKRKPESENNE